MKTEIKCRLWSLTTISARFASIQACQCLLINLLDFQFKRACELHHATYALIKLQITSRIFSSSLQLLYLDLRLSLKYNMKPSCNQLINLLFLFLSHFMCMCVFVFLCAFAHQTQKSFSFHTHLNQKL